MKIAPLDDLQKDLVFQTISASAFFYLVGDALLNGEGLSVVRMADGEKKIIEVTEGFDRLDEPLDVFDKAWREQFGVEGITRREIRSRLAEAAAYSTYLAPSTSGLTMPNYDVYRFAAESGALPPYIDNFYPNVWGIEHKTELFKTAGHVLMIHASRALADGMQIRAKKFFDVKVTFIEMSHWSQADRVAEEATKSDAKLVLFSGGPANKCIAPRISNSGKVVLDIGQAMPYWTFHGYQPK